MRRYDIDDLGNRDPAAIDRFIRLIEQTLLRWHPHVVHGVERMPTGATLLVGNHNACTYMPETYLLSAALYRARGVEALPYGLTHEVALNLPIANQIFSPLGLVRAHRDTALRAFAAGHNVAVYPGGDVDAMRPYSRRNEVVFGGRKGYIRLALEAGVPITPFVCAGAHESMVILSDLRGVAKALRLNKLFRIKALPLSFTLPFGFSLLPITPFIAFRSPLHLEVLAPIHFDRSGPEAADDAGYVARCDAQVIGAMQLALTRLADQRRADKESGVAPGTTAAAA